MTQDVDRAVLSRLPLAEATLHLWSWMADDDHLDDLFARLRVGSIPVNSPSRYSSGSSATPSSSIAAAGGVVSCGATRRGSSPPPPSPPTTNSAVWPCR